MEGSTKVAQVSWFLLSSGADPSWAAKSSDRESRSETKTGRREERSVVTENPDLERKWFDWKREGSTKVAQVSWCPCSWADPSWAAKRFRGSSTTVVPRFHQGYASFVVSLVLRGRSVLGSQKVLWKVPPRLRQASTEVVQVSWCPWSSGADPSWAAKRFCGRFHQGSAKLPPRLCKFFGVPGLPGQIPSGADLSWAAKRFCGRFHQGRAKLPPRLCKFRGVSALPVKRFCGRFHQACAKLPPRLRKFRGVPDLPGQIRLGLPKGFVEGSTKVAPSFHQGCASFVVSLVFGADPSWAAKRLCGRFHQGCASFVVSLVFCFGVR